jgi:hypothetical protein
MFLRRPTCAQTQEHDTTIGGNDQGVFSRRRLLGQAMRTLRGAIASQAPYPAGGAISTVPKRGRMWCREPARCTVGVVGMRWALVLEESKGSIIPLRLFLPCLGGKVDAACRPKCPFFLYL